MPYGNNSGFVRGANKTFGVATKNLFGILIGPILLYTDWAAGANYFEEGFKGHVHGHLEFTLPFLGWHINWSAAAMFGFGLSIATSGVQIVMWNLLKSGVRLKHLSLLQLVAVIAGLSAFILDVCSDLGGSTIWLSSTHDGSLWPHFPDMFDTIMIPLIVILGVSNEALLDFFFGLDSPLVGNSTFGQKIRSRLNSRRLSGIMPGDGIPQGIDVELA